MKIFPSFLLLLLLPPSLFAAEAFELGEHNFNERPLGKEADAIAGDFVLRNDRVEAVISGNLPLRRANMSTFYGSGGITPGCLYDLSLRDADNDQLVAFCPLNQKGPINYVRILEEGGAGKDATVEVFASAVKRGGISITHTYRLKDGEAGLRVRTVLRNETGDTLEQGDLRDVLVKFRKSGKAGGINWFDAIDPADHCGYAVGTLEGSKPPPGKVSLKPGESYTYNRVFAVGISPAAAVSRVAQLQGDTGRLTATVRDLKGQALAGARAQIKRGNSVIPAYPDAQGKIELDLPPGPYELVVGELGRPVFRKEVTLEQGQPQAVEAKLKDASAIAFAVRDAQGISMPCKVQFNPLGETKKPDLGPTDRAHGCVDQYFSETGRFVVQLDPGSYEVVVTRGPEYSHYREEVDLAPEKTHRIEAVLKRLVQTPGWVSTDYHNHSTPSGDNTCGTDDRVISMAAEHLEFTPTTEHNRLYDWAPHIQKLGLSSFMKTVPGMELTGRGAHFNAFPFKPDPTRQDGGAPSWQADPRLNAIVLRDFQNRDPDRWVHLNHPDMSLDFIDRNGDGKADGGFAYFGRFLDALETQNYKPSDILATAPYRISDWPKAGGRVKHIREFIWLQLLNQGLSVWGIAVSDAHHVHGNGVGGWRTWVPSSTDEPSKIDWRELSRNSKAGRMILSTGPFLEVETGSGIIAGGHDRVSGELKLKVKVQCSDWLDIDRVQVLVNSRQVPEYNYTRKSHPDMFKDGVVKFDHTLTLKLSQDAHIIVVAIGEGHDLKRGFGSSRQSANKPVAYNNPIFVDVDGGGFSPNYDTLGFDLPVKNLKVKAVEAALGLGK